MKLCNNCKKKWDNYKKERQYSFTFTIKAFVSHERNREACFSVSRPSKSKGFFWKNIDELMLSINFIRLKDCCIEERIYYQPKYTNSCVVRDITLKISHDYEWKLIVNCHTVDDPVIADIPEVLNQD